MFIFFISFYFFSFELITNENLFQYYHFHPVNELNSRRQTLLEFETFAMKLYECDARASWPWIDSDGFLAPRAAIASNGQPCARATMFASSSFIAFRTPWPFGTIHLPAHLFKIENEWNDKIRSRQVQRKSNGKKIAAEQQTTRASQPATGNAKETHSFALNICAFITFNILIYYFYYYNSFFSFCFDCFCFCCGWILLWRLLHAVVVGIHAVASNSYFM